jgi:hypothetical protein
MIKGRIPLDLHRGCPIKGRVYQNDVLTAVLIKDGSQIRKVLVRPLKQS